MPKLPTANAMGPRPTPSAIVPVVREEGLAAPTRAMQQLGETIQRVGDDYGRRQDEAAFFDAQVQVNDWEAANLHDPEKGAKSKRGKDAFELTKTLPESFDQFRDKVVTGLSNNNQRRAVGKLFESRRAQIIGWTGDYVGRERESYEDGVFKAGLTSSIGRVALDPALIDQELRNQTVAVVSRMKRQGRDQAEIDVAIGGLGTAMHTAVLDTYLGEEQYSDARAYFSKVSEQLTPDARAKYKKAVDEAGLRQQSQQQADVIIAQAGGRSEAMRLAKAIEDPEVRDATEQRVSRYWSEREQSQNERESKAYSEALSLVENDMAKARAEIPVATWNAMSGEQQARVNDRLRQKATGADVVTDSKVYYELDQLAAENPQRFGELDLVPFFQHLGPADREKISGLQRSVKAGQIAGFKGQREIREELVNDFFKGPRGKAPEADAMRQRFDDAVTVHIETKGKRPDINELRAIRAGLVKDVVLKDRSLWFDDTRKVYEIGIEDVPEADRAEIEAALKKPRKGFPSGRAVTEQAIVELYLKGRQ